MSRSWVFRMLLGAAVGTLLLSAPAPGFAADYELQARIDELEARVDELEAGRQSWRAVRPVPRIGAREAEQLARNLKNLRTMTAEEFKEKFPPPSGMPPEIFVPKVRGSGAIYSTDRLQPYDMPLERFVPKSQWPSTD